MRKNLVWIFILIFVIFLLISCTDSVKKILHFAEDVRVEYSKCTACYECINDFQCPENAIPSAQITDLSSDFKKSSLQNIFFMGTTVLF